MVALFRMSKTESLKLPTGLSVLLRLNEDLEKYKGKLLDLFFKIESLSYLTRHRLIVVNSVNPPRINRYKKVNEAKYNHPIL